MRIIFFAIVFAFIGWYTVVNMTADLAGWLSPGLSVLSPN
jgi:hypothetical protein